MDVFFNRKDGTELNSEDMINYYDNSHIPPIHLVRNGNIFTNQNNLGKKYKLIGNFIYPLKKGGSTSYVWYKP